MDVIIKLRNRLECKTNYTLPALLPNKLNIMRQGLVTSGENIRNKRAIPALAIIQGIATIGRMMIKGINALIDAKRASSFNNAIKLVNENVQITHDRLITLENRTAMMAKAISPVLKDFKEQINNTNDYKKIMNYLLFSETHRYPGTDCTSPLQEDPEADTFIIQKFKRDLVYYNNMQKLIKK